MIWPAAWQNAEVCNPLRGALWRRFDMNPFLRLCLTVPCLLAAVLLGGCATNAVTGRQQFMIVPESAAIANSASAYNQMIAGFSKSGKVVHDPALQGRIERITGFLVAQAVRYRPETQAWKWEVNVIDEPDTINAFCMAGGRMAVYTGLLKAVQPTDDELAEVMGHEIGHAIANHSAEKMSMALAGQLGVLAATSALDTPRSQQLGAQAGMAAVNAIVLLPNSRLAESEADRIGIELAARAGYRPEAAVSLWQKMLAHTGGKGGSDFLSTHPAPEKRISALQGLVPSMEAYYDSTETRPYYNLRTHTLRDQ